MPFLYVTFFNIKFKVEGFKKLGRVK